MEGKGKEGEGREGSEGEGWEGMGRGNNHITKYRIVPSNNARHAFYSNGRKERKEKHYPEHLAPSQA